MSLLALRPTPYLGKGSPWAKELLQDRNFDALGQVTQGVSGRWIANPAGSVQKTASMSDVQVDHTPLNGVRIDLPKGHATLTQNSAKLAKLDQGGWLVGGLWAKAGAGVQLDVRITMSTASGPVQIVQRHPANGKWHKLDIVVPLPDDLLPGPVSYSIEEKASSSGSISIANPSVYLAPPNQRNAMRKMAGLPEDELVLNGGFERYAYGGFPYPWSVSAWGGAKPFARVMPLDKKKNEHVAVLGVAPSGGGIMISQRIDPEAGMQWKATARGLAKGNKELALRVRVFVKSREMTALTKTAPNPHTGKWEPMSLTLKLPSNVEPDYFMVDILRRGGADKLVQVDKVSVTRVR